MPCKQSQPKRLPRASYWMLISKAERERIEAPSKPARLSPCRAVSMAFTMSALETLAEREEARGFWYKPKRTALEITERTGSPNSAARSSATERVMGDTSSMRAIILVV